jgi:hypothetical protein
MAESEARYMRRKVKAGLIEADHEECAIVVHYEVEATVLGDMGEPIVAERQENHKRIKLKTLNENTNIPRLAQEMVEKCKLIHPSKMPLVENLLFELQEHRLRLDKGQAGGKESRRRRKKDEQGNDREGEKPSLKKLDQYIEGMYDGTEAATQSTYMILQLARSPDNLETMLQNEALLGLLSRLLKEEGRKSMDLAINIIYILYSFSNFSQFHTTLQQAQVGNTIMQLIELETKRHAVREREREQEAQAQGALPREDEHEKEKRHKLVLRKQEKLLYVCFHVLLNLAEEPEIERKMAKRGIVFSLMQMLERSNPELLVLVLIFLKKLAIFKENLPSFRSKVLLGDKLVPFVPNHAEALAVSSLRCSSTSLLTVRAARPYSLALCCRASLRFSARRSSRRS